MKTERMKETNKHSYTGVVTRSRRKSSLVLENHEESQNNVKKELIEGKRSELENDELDLKELQELQGLFSDFIEALNDSEEVSEQKGIRRVMRTRGSIKKENDETESTDLTLKRVKRESREIRKNKKSRDESRRTLKKKVNLKPIAEEILKENQINGEEVTKRKEETETKIETINSVKPDQSELIQIPIVDPKDFDLKNQILENKINGKII